MNGYSPVGRCIYCAKSAEEAGPGGLQEEHIIPFALGGTLELPEASCERCAKETHAFEGYCAGKMFKPARTHFHWRSRKSKRPNKLRIGPPFGDAGQEIPVADHPPMIALPTFQAPGILFGLKKEEGTFAQTGVQLCFGPGFRERWERLGRKADISTPFTIDTFGRMLAKIAHSYVVAELGVDGFTPFLPGLILGESAYYSYYIGSPVGLENPAPELHTLKLDRLNEMIVVYVRLYAKFGGPSYMVVVGQSKP